MCVVWAVLISTLNIFLPLRMEVLLILSLPDVPLCVHMAHRQLRGQAWFLLSGDFCLNHQYIN